jgi:hypothetical protein
MSPIHRSAKIVECRGELVVLAAALRNCSDDPEGFGLSG